MLSASIGFFVVILLLSIYPCVYQDVFLTYSFDNFNKGTNFIEFNFSFSMDSLSLWFALLVSVIGFGTNLYTLGYFRGEADEGSFVFD